MIPFLQAIDADDYLLIPFDSGAVLFNEAQQSVLVLNQTAAFLWCVSFDVESSDELALKLAEHFSISLDIARHDVAHFFDEFHHNSFSLVNEEHSGSFLTPIRDIPFSNYFPVGDSNSVIEIEPVIVILYGVVFELNITSAIIRNEVSRIYTHAIHSCDDSLFSFNQSKTVINVIAETDTFLVFVNQECVSSDLGFEQLVPFISGVIFETFWDVLVDSEALMFHSAVLSQESGRVFLFPGEAGAGKSTLSAVLAMNKWSFFTDELAIFLPDGKGVLPCPLPVCVKDGAVDFLSGYYSKLSECLPHHRLDGRWVRYLPIDMPSLSDAETFPIASGVIFPEYCHDVSCEFTVLDKVDALRRFLACGSSGRALTGGELNTIVRMIEELDCYSLVYSDIDQALKAVEYL